jgi:large subunit ribosomal protein L22
MVEKKKPGKGEKTAGAKRPGGAKAAPPRTSKLGERFLRRKPAEPVAAPPVEARALARYVRLSPQKARLVVDLIRGKAVGDALHVLRFTKKRPASHIEKVLRSAIANAEQKSETVDVDRLYVKHAVVNEGSRLKRTRSAPFGRGYMYQRRTCHIEIRVAERGRDKWAAAAPAPAAAEASS